MSSDSPVAVLHDSGGTEKGTPTNPVRVDPTGSTVQPVSATALPLPAGAATAAKQDTGNTSLASLDTKLPTQGQKAMAGSVPVTMASDQGPVPVSMLPTPTSVIPHYFAVFDRIVPAANKWMATLFNPEGSTKVVRVRRVYCLDWQASGNQSATLDQYLERITARTVGTSVPVRKFDTSAPAPTALADTNSSAVTEDHLIRRFFAAVNAINFSNANWYNSTSFAMNGCVFAAEAEVSPIVLRAGEGIAMRNITSQTAGSCSYVIEFTEADE